MSRFKKQLIMAANPIAKPKPGKKMTSGKPVFLPTETGRKRRILVVDDDRQIRESLQKLLCLEGYEVVLAATGQQGIERFSANPFDLLILDLNLPDIIGWDVFGTITSRAPFLPIIIITGRHNQIEMATAAGVGALLEKPLNITVFLQAVAQLLAEPPETSIKRLAGLEECLKLPISPEAPGFDKQNQWTE